MMVQPRYRCIRCKRYQDEESGEDCHNPNWHDRQPTRPVAPSPSVRMPYPEDDDDPFEVEGA